MTQPLIWAGFHVVLILACGYLGWRMACREFDRKLVAPRADRIASTTHREVHNILEHIGSGLLLLDREGRVTRINPEAERILRVRGDNVRDRFLPAVLGEGMAEFCACIERVLAGEPPVFRHELRIRYNGDEMPVGISVNRLAGAGGRPAGCIAIFKDLTEVNRIRERMREADRLAGVGELAASIAHEVRNPLGSIRGSVEILAGELDLSGHQAQLLELILKESARVNTIINDFLAFARLRPAQRRMISARQFLEEVALQIRQHIAVHGDNVKLTYQALPADMKLRIDSGQLTQLFLNLAINACEAMEYAGELTLIAKRDADGEFDELQVVDNGPGIADAVRGDLFKPFVTTKKTGTGLGLPMVARIAHAHNGRVLVDRVPGGGAVFKVRLYPERRDTEPVTGQTINAATADPAPEVPAEALSLV